MADAAYESTAELAVAINGAISGEPELGGISVVADGDSLVFRNTNDEAVDAKFNLVTTATATAEVGYTAATELANGATEAGILDITNSDFTDGGTLTIGGEFIDLDAGATGGDIASAIEEAIGVQGVTVSFDTNTFDITNGSGESYTLPDISVRGFGNGSEFLNSSVEVAAYEPETLADKFAGADPVALNVNVDGTQINIEAANNLNDVVAEINEQTKNTGVSAFLNNDGSDIVFSASKGTDFDVTITADTDGDGEFNINKEVEATSAANTVSLDAINISDRAGADEALVAIDYAIDQINQFRSDLGAVQNRFESTIANLSTSVENLSASNSRIVDADFAAETANLAKSQVLQQAGISVLAQANARPQQVLSLLQ